MNLIVKVQKRTLPRRGSFLSICLPALLKKTYTLIYNNNLILDNM